MSRRLRNCGLIESDVRYAPASDDDRHGSSANGLAETSPNSRQADQASVTVSPHQFLFRFVPAAVIAIAGACFLFDWVVDDAAISYSYARNAARWLGLVSQQGRPPVEGFSNPLWVALLSAVAGFPGVAPKLALKCLSWTFQAGFLGAAAFATITRGVPLGAASLFTALLALEPPLLIWSNAGLESPLLFFGILVLGEALAATIGSWRRRSILLAGSAAAACALTRPEGALLGLGGLVVLALARETPAPVRLRAASIYTAIFGLPLFSYLALRRFYFHDWLPNTFYAKGGLTGPRLLDALTLSPHAIAKVLEVAEAVGGYFGATAVVILFVGFAVLLLRRSALSCSSRAYLVLACAAVLAYVLLPGDWMGEYRYASPAVLLLSMAIFHMSADLWHNSGRQVHPLHIRTIVRAVILAMCVLWIGRVFDFRSHLPLPLAEVIGRARLFERASQILHVERASILTQDVGGFLLRDRMDLYDVGMLTDRRIARAIGEWRAEPDHADLHSYIFEQVKPDFISLVAYHAWAARLDTDPRLTSDYVRISTRQDEWVLRRYGIVLESGDYARKDRVHNAAELAKVRALLATTRGP